MQPLTSQITQNKAAKLGLAFFTFTSGLVVVYIYCKKTNLILKVKKLGFVSKKNKKLFFSNFVYYFYFETGIIISFLVRNSKTFFSIFEFFF